MGKENEVKEFYERPEIVLDLTGLNDEQRRAGSILMGGSAAEFIQPEDEFEYSQVSGVVFHWGDERAIDKFATLLEHIEPPSDIFFPFSPAAIVGNMAWLLTLQPKDWHPDTAYQSPEDYHLLPYDHEAGVVELITYLDKPTPRPELLGKVGARYVYFSMMCDVTPGSYGSA